MKDKEKKGMGDREIEWSVGKIQNVVDEECFDIMYPLVKRTEERIEMWVEMEYFNASNYVNENL